MTAVHLKRTMKIARLPLVFALAVVASATVAALAERVDRDHAQESQAVPPDVESHMQIHLGLRSAGDLFPQR